MEIAALTAVKPLAVGFLDGAEYAWFNPKVHEIHNFPDIVPAWPRGTTPAAFASGVLVSWWLYLPLALILFLIVHFNKDEARKARITYAAAIVSAVAFGGLFLMMFVDNMMGRQWASRDPFVYHKAFYVTLASAEIIILLVTICM